MTLRGNKNILIYSTDTNKQQTFISGWEMKFSWKLDNGKINGKRSQQLQDAAGEKPVTLKDGCSNKSHAGEDSMLSVYLVDVLFTALVSCGKDTRDAN